MTPHAGLETRRVAVTRRMIAAALPAALVVREIRDAEALAPLLEAARESSAEQ